MQILIVDDNQAILNSLSALLTARDYFVDTACNGLDASEKLQAKAYDLFIVDHLMPIMNGIQLIKNIRQIAHYSLTPIVFMTTQGKNSLKSQYQNDQFSVLIDKPIDESSLLSLLSSYQKPNTRYLSL